MADQPPLTLWGASLSLYTGKVRSYLVKKGLPYREVFPSHPRFQAHVVPTLRLVVIPVLEMADGALVQDSTDIIDHLEARHPEPRVVPDTPVQRAVAWLLEAFGSEALLPAAMHYRWSFRDRHEPFLRAEFGRGFYAGPDRTAQREAGTRFMEYFGGFLPSLGVTPATIPAIEAGVADLLDALDVHFQAHPYLLGGRPSVADFGFMAPLFAHLARDPVPATLMKTIAPNVHRWTERMNLPDVADGEFPDRPATYLPDDAIPPTLERILALVFADWGPELLATAAGFDAWAHGKPAGTLVATDGARRTHPSIGPVEFDWRGGRIVKSGAPQSLWHFERARRVAAALSGEARRRFDALVERTGGTSVMQVDLARPLRRDDYVLVLG